MSDQTIQETNPVEPTPEIQEPGNLQPEKKPKGRKKAFRYVSMLVVVVIVLSGIFMLWWIAGEMKRQKKEAEAAAKAAKESQKADQEQQEKPKVKVYKVSKGEFIWVMETLGTIEAKSKVELRFEVNGIVDTINNKEGDQVKEGDILAEINHEDAELKIKFRRSKLEEARIEEKNWKIKVDQNKVLMDNGALTPLKHEESVLALERAKQGTKSAKIELDSAQSELEKTYLKCPIDGMVRSAKIQKGEYVTSQTKVMEIMEINEVHCEFQVLEKDIQDVHKDLKISLSLDAYPGEMFSGSIVSMGTIVQTTEGRFRKVTALVQNESGKIIPGMFAKVKVILIHEEDVITIPNSAFLDIQKDTSSIWVVEEEKSLKREVSVKHFNNDSALIETGLKVGDQVVIDVAMVKLEEGKPVEIVEVKEASASGK